MAKCFYRSGEFCDVKDGEIFEGSDGKCDCRGNENTCHDFLDEDEIDRAWEKHPINE
jgi:hypothetical protein